MTMTLQNQAAAGVLPVLGPHSISWKADALLRDCLSREEREILGNYASTRLVEAGEVLWREGERGDRLAMIVSGKVQTMKDTEFDGRRVVVGLHGTGSVIGAESVVAGSPVPETARSVTAAELLVLSKNDFDRMMEESPAFAMKSLKGLLQVVSNRLRHSIERLSTFF